MALANTKKVLSGGFRIAWFCPLDSDGYFAGKSGSLTPGSTGQPGYFISGVKGANYKGAEPLVLLGTGEDQPQGQIIEPPQTLPSFDLTGSVADLTLDALLQTTNTVDIGNATFGIIQPHGPAYIDGALLLMRLSISKDTATSGEGNWDGVLFPKVKVVPLSSEGMEEKKITTFRWHVICNPSTIFPTGISVGSTGLAFGASDGVEFPFSSPNKVAFYGWKGDGSTTVFNLAGTDLTLATGLPQVTYKEGVKVVSGLTVATSGSNYTWTFTSAPASANRIITMVEQTQP